MERLKLLVKGSMVSKRLDLAILDGNTGLSRRRIRSIIDIGGAYVNKKRVRVASRKVNHGDIIELEYNPRVSPNKAPKLEIKESDILFENERMLAFNKPPGLPSQATRSQAVFHVTKLLEDFIAKRDGEKPNLHLVHRLDKETSGVLLVAKDKEALNLLSDQFRARTIKKCYHALVYGLSKKDEFEVKCRLSSIHPETGVVKISNKSGKDSWTQFRVLDRFEKFKLTRMECQPITGRSHQIRVHLCSENLPIIGDKVYGNAQAVAMSDELKSLTTKHHFLHCRSMTFVLPGTDRSLQVKASYPEAFKDFYDKLTV
jgi:RluA family pseudouridine synthase